MKTIAYTRFWILLGPWMALMFSTLTHIRSGVYLPSIFLLSLPLCCRFRFTGLSASLTLLTAIVALKYPDTPLQERFWVVGSALAMALTFVVATLSFEEADENLKEVVAESKSRLAKMRRLDESLRDEIRKRQMEGKEYEARIAHLQRKTDTQVVEEMSTNIEDLTCEKTLLEKSLQKVQKS